MPDLTVTLIQTELVWEDRQANLAHIETMIGALNGHTDVVLLPEMFSTGFTMNAAPLAETMQGQTVGWLKNQARRIRADIAGSLIIAHDGNYYNRFCWAKPNGNLQAYDKKHLFRMSGENKVYTAGTDSLVVKVKGWRIKPFICYDLRFPIWCRNLHNHYDIAVFVANWPTMRVDHWRALLQARAIENQCYVLGVNRVGTDGNDLAYSGDSAVIDPTGRFAWSLSHAPAVHTHTLRFRDLEAQRQQFPVWMDADDPCPALPDSTT